MTSHHFPHHQSPLQAIIITTRSINLLLQVQSTREDLVVDRGDVIIIVARMDHRREISRETGVNIVMKNITEIRVKATIQIARALRKVTVMPKRVLTTIITRTIHTIMRLRIKRNLKNHRRKRNPVRFNQSRKTLI